MTTLPKANVVFERTTVQYDMKETATLMGAVGGVVAIALVLLMLYKSRISRICNGYRTKLKATFFGVAVRVEPFPKEAYVVEARNKQNGTDCYPDGTSEGTRSAAESIAWFFDWIAGHKKEYLMIGFYISPKRENTIITSIGINDYLYRPVAYCPHDDKLEYPLILDAIDSHVHWGVEPNDHISFAFDAEVAKKLKDDDVLTICTTNEVFQMTIGRLKQGYEFVGPEPSWRYCLSRLKQNSEKLLCPNIMSS